MLCKFAHPTVFCTASPAPHGPYTKTPHDRRQHRRIEVVSVTQWCSYFVQLNWLAETTLNKCTHRSINIYFAKLSFKFHQISTKNHQQNLLFSKKRYATLPYHPPQKSYCQWKLTFQPWANDVAGCGCPFDKNFRPPEKATTTFSEVVVVVVKWVKSSDLFLNASVDVVFLVNKKFHQSERSKKCIFHNLGQHYLKPPPIVVMVTMVVFLLYCKCIFIHVVLGTLTGCTGMASLAPQHLGILHPFFLKQGPFKPQRTIKQQNALNVFKQGIYVYFSENIHKKAAETMLHYPLHR